MSGLHANKIASAASTDHADRPVGRRLTLETFARDGDQALAMEAADRAGAAEEARRRDAAIAETARAEGHAQGRAEAERDAADAVAAAEARAQTAEARASAYDAAVAEAVRAANAARAAALASGAEELGGATRALIAALTPTLIARGFADEAVAAVRDWAAAAAAPGGTLRLAPDAYEALGEKIRDDLESADLSCHLVADAALDAGAARFEWTDGFGALDLAAAAAALDDALARASAPAPIAAARPDAATPSPDGSGDQRP